MSRSAAVVIVLASLVAAPVAAQTANPLNPRSGAPSGAAPSAPQTQATPPQTAPVEADETKSRRTQRSRDGAKDQDATAKPKREMSPAQKRNADIMRSCGAEWREKRDSLKARGETWRTFLAACRKRQTA